MLGEKYIEVRGKKEKKKYRFSECTKLYLPSTHVLKKGRGRKKKKKKKSGYLQNYGVFPVPRTPYRNGSWFLMWTPFPFVVEDDNMNIGVGSMPLRVFLLEQVKRMLARASEKYG